MTMLFDNGNSLICEESPNFLYFSTSLRAFFNVIQILLPYIIEYNHHFVTTYV